MPNKAQPARDNAIFETKVLSRSHAEMWFNNGKVRRLKKPPSNFFFPLSVVSLPLARLAVSLASSAVASHAPCAVKEQRPRHPPTRPFALRAHRKRPVVAPTVASHSHLKVYIKDTKSSNGTFVNDERLSPSGVESEARVLQSGKRRREEAERAWKTREEERGEAGTTENVAAEQLPSLGAHPAATRARGTQATGSNWAWTCWRTTLLRTSEFRRRARQGLRFQALPREAWPCVPGCSSLRLRMRLRLATASLSGLILSLVCCAGVCSWRCALSTRMWPTRQRQPP